MIMSRGECSCSLVSLHDQLIERLLIRIYVIRQRSRIHHFRTGVRPRRSRYRGGESGGGFGAHSRGTRHQRPGLSPLGQLGDGRLRRAARRYGRPSRRFGGRRRNSGGIYPPKGAATRTGGANFYRRLPAGGGRYRGHAGGNATERRSRPNPRPAGIRGLRPPSGLLLQSRRSPAAGGHRAGGGGNGGAGCRPVFAGSRLPATAGGPAFDGKRTDPPPIAPSVPDSWWTPTSTGWRRG